MTIQWMYLINNAAMVRRCFLMAANTTSTAVQTENSGGLTPAQIIGVMVAIAGVVFLLIRRNLKNKKDSNTKAPQVKKEGFKIPGRDKNKNTETNKAQNASEEKPKSKTLGFKRPGDDSKKKEAVEEEPAAPQGINNGINNKYLNVPKGGSYSPKVGYTVDLSAGKRQPQNPYTQQPVQNAVPQFLLAAIAGPLTNYAVPIPTSGEITIGRGEGNTVAFPEYVGEVSHSHAKLMYVNGMLSLVDTNSVNGTFLVGTGQINPMQAYAIGEGSTFYVGCDKNGFQIIRAQ